MEPYSSFRMARRVSPASAAWGLIWRMTLWGFCAGALIGLIYGAIIVFPVGGLYGVLFGCIFGVVTGVISGALMAAIIALTPFRTKSTDRYSRLMALVPIVVILGLEILIIALTVASDWHSFMVESDPLQFVAGEWTRLLMSRWEWMMFYLPGITALVPAWYAARKAAEWAAGE